MPVRLYHVGPQPGFGVRPSRMRTHMRPLPVVPDLLRVMNETAHRRPAAQTKLSLIRPTLDRRYQCRA